MLKFFIIFCLFLYVPSWVHAGDNRAFWVAKCNGEVDKKTKYLVRPISKKNEDLSTPDKTCYHLKKEIYTYKYGRFDPLLHKDKLILHLYHKKLKAGEVQVELKIKKTDVESFADCFKKMKILDEKEFEKKLTLSVKKEKPLIINFSKLEELKDWSFIDLIIDIKVTQGDKVIFTRNEKFLNWKKCNPYQ